MIIIIIKKKELSMIYFMTAFNSSCLMLLHCYQEVEGSRDHIVLASSSQRG